MSFVGFLGRAIILLRLLATLFSAKAQASERTLLFSHQEDSWMTADRLAFLLATLKSRKVKSGFLFSPLMVPAALKPDIVKRYGEAFDAGHAIGLALDCSASMLPLETDAMVALIESSLDALSHLFQSRREAQYQYVYFQCPDPLSASAQLALRAKKILPIFDETVEKIASFEDVSWTAISLSPSSSLNHTAWMLLARTNDPSILYLAHYLDATQQFHHVSYVPIEEQLLSLGPSSQDAIAFIAASTGMDATPAANNGCRCRRENDGRLAATFGAGWMFCAALLFCLPF